MRQANASPPLLSVLSARSEAKQSLGPQWCFFALPGWPPVQTVSIQKPQALLSLGPSKPLQLKERNHAWKSWNNFLQPAPQLSRVTASVSQEQKWDASSTPFISGPQSAPINQCQETLGKQVWALSCREVSRQVTNPFTPQGGQNPGILFPTLFSPHRLCPLQPLTPVRLWARETGHTGEVHMQRPEQEYWSSVMLPSALLCTLARKLYKVAPYPSTTPSSLAQLPDAEQPRNTFHLHTFWMQWKAPV